MPKKGPVVVLTLPDGGSVIGEVLGELQGTYTLRRPLVFRQHPLIDGLVVKKYNKFTSSKSDPVVFNAQSIVATYWTDKAMAKVYRRLAKVYQTDTLQFGVLGEQNPAPAPVPPSGVDLARAINGDQEEEINFEELRNTTTRLKD